MNTNTQQVAGDDDFAALFEQSIQESPEVKEGSIVTGTVVDIIGDYAVVDIGIKAEGQVPLREFAEEESDVQVAIGDKCEVLLESLEDHNGQVILSKDKARKRKVWDEIQEACEAYGIVLGTITARDISWASQLGNGEIWVKFMDGTQLGMKSSATTITYIDAAGKVTK